MEMLVERRPYMQQLRELRDEHIIKVITGVRRCGKSTLLEMFADELRQTVPEDQIQFYNFEDPDIFAIGDYKQIYDHIKVKLVDGKQNYIFLDEVQNINNLRNISTLLRQIPQTCKKWKFWEFTSTTAVFLRP